MTHADHTRAIEREVVALHRFFQAWYRGELAPTDGAFARFEGALAPGFVIVTPDGRALDRATIIAAVRGAHGGDPSAAIWIEHVALRWAEPESSAGVVVATYEEWQRLGGEPPRGRLSTAVLERDPDAPGGWRWRHVHETWLPAS